MDRATISIESERAVLEFTYHPLVIGELKQRIPSSCRRWHPESKTWTVKMTYIDEVLDIFDMYGFLTSLGGTYFSADYQTVADYQVAVKYIQSDYGDRFIGTTGHVQRGDIDWNIVFEEGAFAYTDVTAEDAFIFLGVSATDDDKTVRKKYLALSKKHFPLKIGDDDEMFKRINNEYRKIDTTNKRTSYARRMALVHTLMRPTSGKPAYEFGLLTADGYISDNTLYIGKVKKREDIYCGSKKLSSVNYTNMNLGEIYA